MPRYVPLQPYQYRIVLRVTMSRWLYVRRFPLRSDICHELPGVTPQDRTMLGHALAKAEGLVPLL